MLRVTFLCVALLGVANARMLLTTDHLSQQKGDSNVRFAAHPLLPSCSCCVRMAYSSYPSHTLLVLLPLLLPRLCALPTGLGAGYAKVPGCFVVDPPRALGEYRLLERGRCREAQRDQRDEGCGHALRRMRALLVVCVRACVVECVQHDDAQMPRGTTSAGKEDGEGWCCVFISEAPLPSLSLPHPRPTYPLPLTHDSPLKSHARATRSASRPFPPSNRR